MRRLGDSLEPLSEFHKNARRSLSPIPAFRDTATSLSNAILKRRRRAPNEQGRDIPSKSSRLRSSRYLQHYAESGTHRSLVPGPTHPVTSAATDRCLPTPCVKFVKRSSCQLIRYRNSCTACSYQDRRQVAHRSDSGSSVFAGVVSSQGSRPILHLCSHSTGDSETDPMTNGDLNRLRMPGQRLNNGDHTITPNPYLVPWAIYR